MADTINIAGKDKAEVLAALYNGCKGCRRKMDAKEAKDIVEDSRGRVDTINGLAIKVDLSKDEIWMGAYDRYNGDGAMRKALQDAGLL